MSNPLKKLALAASYVTSLPGLKKPESEDELAGLAKYLPTVGTIIGALLVGAYLACAKLAAGEWLCAFILIAFWLLLTRGIHLDGLMDAADGLFSHRSRDEMLRIMKDSRVGNFGVISGLLIVLAKLIGLASIRPDTGIVALLLIPAWARWVEVFAIAMYPYARSEGMGKIWQESTKPHDLFWSAILPLAASLGVCFYYHNFASLLIIPLTIIPGMLFANQVHHVLYGQTGDTYGASVEFSEATALILIALLQELPL